LELRRNYREIFLDGDYIPLQATGSKEKNLCAFARHKGESWILAVVPRLTTRLVRAGTAPLGKKVWSDTMLLLPKKAPVKWQNSITGEVVTATTSDSGISALHIHAVLRRFPVALLHTEIPPTA
jgi:(1->4)-alpha-D-glucan 1-alpha-D-glucosylmutase